MLGVISLVIVFALILGRAKVALRTRVLWCVGTLAALLTPTVVSALLDAVAPQSPLLFIASSARIFVELAGPWIALAIFTYKVTAQSDVERDEPASAARSAPPPDSVDVAVPLAFDVRSPKVARVAILLGWLVFFCLCLKFIRGLGAKALVANDQVLLDVVIVLQAAAATLIARTFIALFRWKSVVGFLEKVLAIGALCVILFGLTVCSELTRHRWGGY